MICFTSLMLWCCFVPSNQCFSFGNLDNFAFMVVKRFTQSLTRIPFPNGNLMPERRYSCIFYRKFGWKYVNFHLSFSNLKVSSIWPGGSVSVPSLSVSGLQRQLWTALFHLSRAAPASIVMKNANLEFAMDKGLLFKKKLKASRNLIRSLTLLPLKRAYVNLWYLRLQICSLAQLPTR